ncbi:MAG: hypothetical protein ACTSRU_18880, partial [Candidatus Hodarchaeales archaeon]
SRGLFMGDIRKMLFLELLAIDSLGVIFGMAIGFTAGLLYKDVLIRTLFPVYYFIPWIKILFFMLFLLVSHLLVVFGQVHWYSKSSIVTHLRIRD